MAGFAGVVTVEVSVRRLLQVSNVAHKVVLRKADRRKIVRHGVAVLRVADALTTRAGDRVKAGRLPPDQVSTVVVSAVVDLAAEVVGTQVVADPVPVLVAVVAGSVAADLAAAASEAAAAAVEIPVGVEAAVVAADKAAAADGSPRSKRFFPQAR